MGWRNRRKQAEGGWNLGGKGLSVADVATYKPHVDNKDYAAHMSVTVKRQRSDGRSNRYHLSKTARNRFLSPLSRRFGFVCGDGL